MPIVRAHNHVEHSRAYARYGEFHLLGLRTAEMNLRLVGAMFRRQAPDRPAKVDA